MATPSEIRIRFTRSPNYHLLPVNGAWGGPSVQGNLAVDFYVERLATPEAIIHSVDESGVGPETRIPDQNVRSIERELVVGFLLTPAAARAIGEWLITKADEHDRLAGADSEEGSDGAS